MIYIAWGTNFPKVKTLLQEVFKRQSGVHINPHGHKKIESRWTRVDWIGVMFEMGSFMFNWALHPVDIGLEIVSS